jgi:tRNA-dihydrouridine synthase B
MTVKLSQLAVQIAGTDASMMHDAAAYNIDRGAQNSLIINMGCPAASLQQRAWPSADARRKLALQIIEAGGQLTGK